MPDLTIGNFEIDEDSNGDLVIKDTNDNIVMRWDTGNGNWNFESQTLTNLGSLSTEKATIGGQQSDYHWELVDESVDDFASPVSLSTGGIDGDYHALVEVSWRVGNDVASSLEMRFNGVSSTDYNYDEFSGTSVTGADSFQLVNSSTFQQYLGQIFIGKRERPSFQTIGSSTNWNNGKPSAEIGYLNKDNDVDSVEFIFDDASIARFRTYRRETL